MKIFVSNGINVSQFYLDIHSTLWFEELESRVRHDKIAMILTLTCKYSLIFLNICEPHNILISLNYTIKKHLIILQEIIAGFDTRSYLLASDRILVLYSPSATNRGFSNNLLLVYAIHKMLELQRTKNPQQHVNSIYDFNNIILHSAKKKWRRVII